MAAKSGKSGGKKGKGAAEVRIENRRARHDYAISDTLECGIELVGTEVKSANLKFDACRGCDILRDWTGLRDFRALLC